MAVFLLSQRLHFYFFLIYLFTHLSHSKFQRKLKKVQTHGRERKMRRVRVKIFDRFCPEHAVNLPYKKPCFGSVLVQHRCHRSGTAEKPNCDLAAQVCLLRYENTGAAARSVSQEVPPGRPSLGGAIYLMGHLRRVLLILSAQEKNGRRSGGPNGEPARLKAPVPPGGTAPQWDAAMELSDATFCLIWRCWLAVCCAADREGNLSNRSRGHGLTLHPHRCCCSSNDISYSCSSGVSAQRMRHVFQFGFSCYVSGELRFPTGAEHTVTGEGAALLQAARGAKVK